MPSAISKSEKISDALAAARISYAKSNPKSQEIHKESSSALPGGMYPQHHRMKNYSER